MSAERLVQLLSIAWSSTQLYPDPTSVPAFLQAVAALGELADQPVVVSVDAGGFRHDDEPVEADHAAVARLAQTLFSEQIGSLALGRAPTPDEVVRVFALLESDVEDIGLDLATRADLVGGGWLKMRARELLEDRDEDETDDDMDRHPDVAALFESDSVSSIAASVSGLETTDESATAFIGMYRNAYDHVAEGDVAGRLRVVETFVDALFRLEGSRQAAVFQRALEERADTAFQDFLDQFSADDLERVAKLGKEGTLALLADYARVMTQMTGRASNLDQRIEAIADAEAARDVAARSVGEHLARFLDVGSSKSQAWHAVQAQIRDLDGTMADGARLLGELFDVEDRIPRRERLLRVWVGRVAQLIRAEDYRSAVEWLDVVDTRTDLDPRLLQSTYHYLANDELFGLLVKGGLDSQDERNKLLEAVSRKAGSRILDTLALEEDPGRRRMLIDVVAEMARVDLRSVLPGLSDPRWYVVRNLAVALGKSGRRAAGEPLTRLLGHDDYRVRIEALRALLPCIGPAAADPLIVGLGDEHVRVRATALDLLGSLPDDVVIPALTSALPDESRSLNARVAMVEALGSRETEGARAVLSEMAGSRSRLSSTARALRSAAREALRSGNA